jgi:hypothetical protein
MSLPRPVLDEDRVDEILTTIMPMHEYASEAALVALDVNSETATLDP